MSTVVKLFLASPGGLESEREAAPALVRRLNTGVGRTLGYQLDLVLWEEAPPRFGRPQDVLNSDVDDCVIFVGLVYRRWGTPTGSHASGFEEEYMRALDRRRTSGSPEIMLFFKKVSDESLADPGTQLQAVVNFRRAQEQDNELLFNEFETSEQWHDRFYDALASLLVEWRMEAASVPAAVLSALGEPAVLEMTGRYLASLINNLPDREKLVITLYYYEGLSSSEIGQVLDATESDIDATRENGLRLLHPPDASDG